MAFEKSPAAKHREAQGGDIHRRRCHICVRVFYDSLVGPCPERDGRQVCMYCCRMCEHHYTVPGQIGQRCRVKDRLREEKRRRPDDGKRDGDRGAERRGQAPGNELREAPGAAERGREAKDHPGIPAAETKMIPA